MTENKPKCRCRNCKVLTCRYHGTSVYEEGDLESDD